MKIRSVLLLLPVVVLGSCQKNDKVYSQIEGVNWNTVFHITYDSSDDLTDAITSAMRNVELSLSPFEPKSQISKINRGETDEVDAMITRIFIESKRVNELSNGMFDPTVAPLVNLWGFGYDNSDVLPTDAQLDSCLQLVGIGECSIVDGRMIKKAPGTQLNFSAITKGFGCDEVAAALERCGCENYMVEIGGEVRLKGVNNQGNTWRIQVDAPIDDQVTSERLTVIQISDCGVATSGNYRNFRDTEAGRIAHTISPVTGRPVQSEILSATVIAPTTMTADALATACMALPEADALAMIESLGPGYSALFVLPAASASGSAGSGSGSDSAGSGSGSGSRSGSPYRLITSSRFPALQH